MVDKTKTEPVSLAKAKKDGLRMAKFPLDKYLNWGYGVKSLCLNQVNMLYSIVSTEVKDKLLNTENLFSV